MAGAVQGNLQAEVTFVRNLWVVMLRRVCRDGAASTNGQVGSAPVTAGHSLSLDDDSEEIAN